MSSQVFYSHNAMLSFTLVHLYYWVNCKDNINCCPTIQLSLFIRIAVAMGMSLVVMKKADDAMAK